jgi:ATP-dependent protease ClpP protease subunit
MKPKSKTWYRIKNAASEDEADVFIMNDIGMWGISAERFVQDLNRIDAATINLHINSYGGEVFDAFAMFNAIKAHDAYVIAWVDGVAASAATLPMLAADEVRIADNAMVMIHNPWVFAGGEAKDLRREADVLDKLSDAIARSYSRETGNSRSDIRDMMDATTWFDAAEAVEAGFANEIVDENDDAPADPKNSAAKYFARFINNKDRQRVLPSQRAKALGLTALLAGFNQPDSGKRQGHMPTMHRGRNRPTNRVRSHSRTAVVAAALAATCVWPPEASVDEGVSFGPTGEEFTGTRAVNKDGKGKAAASVKNATPGEIKEAFKNDAAFALERVDKDATMLEHKAAYADHLEKKLANKGTENSKLKAELGRKDPSTAGADSAINTVEEGAPTNGGGGSGGDDLSPLAKVRAKREAAAKARRGGR